MMESSRRAVEAYRRTRLIDGVTGDDDKVAPVYKLDEISAVLKSASHDIVHEMVEYIFRRLEHKSPLVKQKTLRMIKFIVGKSGTEFKREVQRQSAAIRQLFHYQGTPDPLRGDSLNKAVRETARDTITAIFASETPAIEEKRKKMEGFGSSNFDPQSRVSEKKTLLSEVVDIGATSIKQGLNMISNHYGHRFSNNGISKSSSGSYEAPNFRRSVAERDNYYRDSYRDYTDNYEEPSYETKVNAPNIPDPTSPRSDSADEASTDGAEEKLLDSVTPVGGVRLQPSRESVQVFLLAARKLNPVNMHHAFEHKLQAHSWQVRLKALCFLEAILRERSLKAFGEIAQRFEEDTFSIVECTESPQASLRDKAKKVLSMLQGSQNEDRGRFQARKEQMDLPDLIDAGADGNTTSQLNSEFDLLHELSEPSTTSHEELRTQEEDPFAGMSVHASTGSTQQSSVNGTSSLFEGLSIAEEPPKQASNLNDLLGSFESSVASPKSNLADTSSLLESLESNVAPTSAFTGQRQTDSLLQQFKNEPLKPANSSLDSLLQSKEPVNVGLNSLQHPANGGLNSLQTPVNGGLNSLQQSPQAVKGSLNAWQQQPTQAVNVGLNSWQQPNPAVNGGLNAWQQSGHPNFQQQMMYINPVLLSSGALQSALFLQQAVSQGYPGVNPSPSGGFNTGGIDGFDFSGNPYAATSTTQKMEEKTKAFDFISDHVAAARTVKK